MHPDLIPGLPVKTYGFCMALGFLAAWQVLSWLCRRTGRAAEPLSNLLMLSFSEITAVISIRASLTVLDSSRFHFSAMNDSRSFESELTA